jgi:RNA polymerase sigma factor (sigma-70 family)
MEKDSIKDLIIEIKEGKNPNSFEKLRQKFDNLIHSQTLIVMAKFHSLPIEKEDMVNVLLFHLYKLAQDYDLDSKMYFPSYAKMHLKFRAFNYVRELISKNHEILNYRADFTDEFSGTETISIAGIILDKIEDDIDDYAFLNSTEKKILRMMLKEYEVAEIANALKISTSSVYKSKKRISKKLKEELGL